MDLMMKFAVAINLGLTGENRAVEDMRSDFERRLADRDEPLGPSERYADLLKEQAALWGDYDEKQIVAVALPPASVLTIEN